jgi:predicted MFS family arabinose efflux permease
MVYGFAGVIGNLLAGPMTDRYGSRHIAVIALVCVAVLLGILPLTVWSLPLCIMIFAIWGLVAAGTSVPVQHRLVVLDPDTAAVTLSWNSTAMYVGIALSPPLGNLAIGLGGPLLTPVAGALCVLVALGCFLVGLLPRRHPAPAPVEGKSVEAGDARESA